jgi:hypothetical protein
MRRALFGIGVVTGAAAVSFATGGLGLIPAATAASVALGTGAASGLAFGAAGTTPSQDRPENYMKQELLRDYEAEEPLTDWIIELQVPLPPGM